MIDDKWRGCLGRKGEKVKRSLAHLGRFSVWFLWKWRVLRVLLLGFGDGRVREAVHLIFLAFIVKVARNFAVYNSTEYIYVKN